MEPASGQTADKIQRMVAAVTFSRKQMGKIGDETVTTMVIIVTMQNNETQRIMKVAIGKL